MPPPRPLAPPRTPGWAPSRQTFSPLSNAQGVVVGPLDAGPTVPSPFVGKVPTEAAPSLSTETNPTYTVQMVTMVGAEEGDGTVIADANIDSIQWTLNAPAEATISFPKGAYTSTDIHTLGTASATKEVQIYRNGALWFWGPIIGMDSKGSDGKVTCKCAGPDWYLNRQFIDAPQSNRVTNGSFDSGTTGWSTVGSTISFSIDTGTFVTGSQSAKLVQTTANRDEYISQSVALGPNGIGIFITLSAWLFIDSYSGPAFGNEVGGFRGLYVEGRKAGVFQSNNWYPIDNATPRGKWQKVSTSIAIPPDEVWTIETRLYAPQGTVHWDDVKLVAMDSLSANPSSGLTPIPVDISETIHALIAHVQKTYFGKSPLHIGYQGETTGTKIVKDYQFVDHIQFDAALQEFLDRNDGCDYSVDLTPTTRLFHSYAHKRGTDRSGSVTLKYIAGDETNSNVSDYAFSDDGGACITREVVLGEDSGPDREQGEDSDGTFIAGTILQEVRQAPQGTKLVSLQPLAEERLARYKKVPQTIDLSILPSALLHPVIREGDLLNVQIDDGWTQVSRVMRVMRREWEQESNLMTVTCSVDSLL